MGCSGDGVAEWSQLQLRCPGVSAGTHCYPHPLLHPLNCTLTSGMWPARGTQSPRNPAGVVQGPQPAPGGVQAPSKCSVRWERPTSLWGSRAVGVPELPQPLLVSVLQLVDLVGLQQQLLLQLAGGQGILLELHLDAPRLIQHLPREQRGVLASAARATHTPGVTGLAGLWHTALVPPPLGIKPCVTSENCFYLQTNHAAHHGLRVVGMFGHAGHTWASTSVSLRLCSALRLRRELPISSMVAVWFCTAVCRSSAISGFTLLWM